MSGPRLVTPPTVRALGKQAFRAYGIATFPVRPQPEFVIIGAKRAGTTSLYRYLLSHPQILSLFPSAAMLPMAENMKGVHYFDTGYEHGTAWYRSHFPSRLARGITALRHSEPVIVGEASPYYLFHPLAAGRAADTIPRAKLIVMLRDPVARTYSHYCEQRRNGVETLSFEDALEAESDRLMGDEERLCRDAHSYSFAHEHQSYAAQSVYLPALRRWRDRFPSEQVLVVRSEDFYEFPQTIYDQVMDFLGLPARRLDDPKPWNISGGTAMATETRLRLESQFAASMGALEEYLNRDLRWGSR